MREAGTRELKFSCNRIVLSKIVLYIKNDFLKKRNDLIVNKVLDSDGVLNLEHE